MEGRCASLNSARNIGALLITEGGSDKFDTYFALSGADSALHGIGATIGLLGEVPEAYVGVLRENQ
jgi:hypothetical protein